MRCELVRDYRFEAAHFLPRVPDNHKCRRVHGHSYHLTITIAGEVDDATGWLIDFAAMDEVIDPVIARLDHRVLNDIAGLENATCEVLAGWLWRELRRGLPLLTQVVVAETPDARCVYRGE
jgi:6-pyruvoyltetrahydropterin/6-carboxytetrahydropterin synthase